MITTETLVKVLIALVVAGVVAYLFDLFVPLGPKFKKAISLCGGLAMFLYILKCFHLLPK